METVSIRDLRGASLRESARRGKPLAITNYRVLIGVVVPVTKAWVEHLIGQHYAQIEQSIAEGEQAMVPGIPMTTLDHVTAGQDAAGHGQAPGEASALAAAVVAGTVEQAPLAQEVVRRLHSSLNPHRAGPEQDRQAAAPPPRTVRIGDLSAHLIEQAGEAGQTLAVTHERELIGIVIPVTQDLVKYLIEQNMTRVLHNIEVGEKQLGTADKLTTLEEFSPLEAGPEQ